MKESKDETLDQTAHLHVDCMLFTTSNTLGKHGRRVCVATSWARTPHWRGIWPCMPMVLCHCGVRLYVYLRKAQEEEDQKEDQEKVQKEGRREEH